MGDAHERNPDANLTQRGFKTKEDADMQADLLNNIIGRGIGEKNKSLGMRDIASKVLDEFAVGGLYTATETESGDGYVVGKSKITTEQYSSFSTRLYQLDNNGMTDKEAKDRKAKINSGKQQAENNPPMN